MKHPPCTIAVTDAIARGISVSDSILSLMKGAPEIPVDLPGDSMASYNPERSRLATMNISQLNRAADRLDEMGVGSSGWPGLAPEGLNRAQPLPSREVFRLHKVVGKGGFGEVWEALQLTLNRTVAVKRLRKELLDDLADESMARALQASFRQEALTTANLDHPNIVPVHDMGTDEDGSPLMAMKFISGKTWEQIIREDWSTLPMEEFLGKHIPILIQVTQAVAFAHSKGTIHRDLKPAQVIMGEFGEVLLADWGLAVVVNPVLISCAGKDDADFLPTCENATNPAGTPAFMAPEQTLRDGRHLGYWTDVYLLGGVLYFLLTGRPPHRADSPQAAFLKARLGDVTHPNQLGLTREAPEDLAQLAMRAMAPDIPDRLQTANDFLIRLRRFVSGDSDRRESVRLTRDVEERLQENQANFEMLAGCLSELNQALALWPGNREALLARDVVHSSISQTALEAGDLGLARLEAEAVQDEEEKRVLLAKVRAKERSARHRERQRRLGIYATVVLLAGLAAGAAVYHSMVLEERNNADRASQTATVELRRSLDMVETVLRELGEKLSMIEQIDTLPDLAERIVNDLEVASVPIDSDRALVERLTEARADANLRLGELQLASGNSGPAMESLRRSSQYAGQWFLAMQVMAEGQDRRTDGQLDPARNPLARQLMSAFDVQLRSTVLLARAQEEWGLVDEARGSLVQAILSAATHKTNLRRQILGGHGGEDRALAAAEAILRSPRDNAEAFLLDEELAENLHPLMDRLMAIHQATADVQRDQGGTATEAGQVEIAEDVANLYLQIARDLGRAPGGDRERALEYLDRGTEILQQHAGRAGVLPRRMMERMAIEFRSAKLLRAKIHRAMLQVETAQLELEEMLADPAFDQRLGFLDGSPSISAAQAATSVPHSMAAIGVKNDWLEWAVLRSIAQRNLAENIFLIGMDSERAVTIANQALADAAMVGRFVQGDHPRLRANEMECWRLVGSINRADGRIADAVTPYLRALEIAEGLGRLSEGSPAMEHRMAALLEETCIFILEIERTRPADHQTLCDHIAASPILLGAVAPSYQSLFAE